MNRNEPLTDMRTASPDGLDRLLSSFFQSEMPSSWPAAPVPDVTARPMPASRLPGRDRTVTGPRVALAVSVALLLGGCWLLSGRTTDSPVPTPIGVGIDKGGANKIPPHKIPGHRDRTPIKPMP